MGTKPKSTPGMLKALSASTADLSNRIVAKLENWTPSGQIPELCEVPFEGLLEDVHAASNSPCCDHHWNQQLIYMAAVITEMGTYKMNSKKD